MFLDSQLTANKFDYASKGACTGGGFSENIRISTKPTIEECEIHLRGILTCFVEEILKSPQKPPKEFNTNCKKIYREWRKDLCDSSNVWMESLKLQGIECFISCVNKDLETPFHAKVEKNKKNLNEVVRYIHAMPAVNQLRCYISNNKTMWAKTEAALISSYSHKGPVDLNWEPCVIWSGRSPLVGGLPLNPIHIKGYTFHSFKRSICCDGVQVIPRSISFGGKKIFPEYNKDPVESIIDQIAQRAKFQVLPAWSDFSLYRKAWEGISNNIENSAFSSTYRSERSNAWANSQMEPLKAALKIKEIDQDGISNLENCLKGYWHMMNLCDFMPEINIFAAMTVNAGGAKITKYKEVLPAIFSNKYDTAEFNYKKVENTTELNVSSLCEGVAKVGFFSVSQIEEFDVMQHPRFLSFDMIEFSPLVRLKVTWNTVMELPSSLGIAPKSHDMEITKVSIYPGSDSDKVDRIIEILSQAGKNHKLF